MSNLQQLEEQHGNLGIQSQTEPCTLQIQRRERWKMDKRFQRATETTEEKERRLEYQKQYQRQYRASQTALQRQAEAARKQNYRLRKKLNSTEQNQ